MAIYVWISDDRAGDDAVPVFASADPMIVRGLVRLIEKRLDQRETPATVAGDREAR